MGVRERTVEIDEYRNLARALRNAQREAEACAGYILEAETAGDKQLAGA